MDIVREKMDYPAMPRATHSLELREQRMIVLPEPIRESMRAQPLLAGLHVTDAGFFHKAGWHHVQRPQGAPTTLLILCLHGRGWVQQEGGQQSLLEAGSFAWLPAGKAHAYGSDPAEAWSISWAHFDGEQVSLWAGQLGLAPGGKGGVWQIPVERLSDIPLTQIHATLEHGYAQKELLAASSLLACCLATLARYAASSTQANNSSAKDRVRKSLEQLRKQWRAPHSLDELAATAGLSTSQYSLLFKELSGFSPIDFLLRQRVQQACRLLDESRLSVTNIAERCGYEDPYYFTRSFRRVMGCSPRQYRNTTKG